MTSTTTTAGSDTDRQAILDVLAGLYKAWEANDAEAFVADYTDDATVVKPGVYKKDREEIRTTMAAAFAGPLSGSRVAARRGRPLSYRRHGHRGQRGRDHLPWATLSRAGDWCARPGCWSGATVAGASLATTTAPPARASSSRCGAFPLGSRPAPGSEQFRGITALAQS